MGQAFDEHGNILGEAFGDTKREVFDKLVKEHPDANEIRIKKFKEEVDKMKAENTEKDSNV